MGLLIIESDVRFYKRGVLEKRGRGVVEVKKILGGVAIFEYQEQSRRQGVGGLLKWGRVGIYFFLS